jgi:hypothetical protein
VSAGLAARLAFTLEDIEELKIAVDELTAYITGPHGRDGTLVVDFVVYDDSIEITGAGRLAPAQKIPTELSHFSRMILETVTDGASLRHDDGGPLFHLVKRKTR